MLLNYITWDVSPFIYEGEHFAIGWYGTLWVLGLILWIVSQHVLYKHESIPSEYVWYKFLYMCCGVLIGARIGHCWFYEWHLSNNPIHLWGMTFPYRNIFIEKPWLMFDFSRGVHGLASHGGACGLLIAALLLNRKFKTGIIWMFDRAVFGVCLCGACIRLGNLFNSEIYGVATTMPWGFIFVNNGETLPAHPTQIYELLYCLITFVILTYLYCKYDAGKYNGLLFGVFMVCVFATRIGLEFIKNNQEQFESELWLNMGQLLSIPFVMWGIYLIVKSLKEGKQSARVPQGVHPNHNKSQLRNLMLIFVIIGMTACQEGPSMDCNYQGEYFIQKEIDDQFVFDETSNQVITSKCIIYHYTSLNSAGIKDTLSAVLTICGNCWERQSVRGITLWNRPTITKHNDSPSAMNLVAEPLVAKYTHTAVISPDLQGFGCSNKPQAYCYAEVNGRASADALFAAEKILDSIGVQYRNNYYNIGYSQGAQTALAALSFFKGAKVKTFLGDGIYDLVDYYNQALETDFIAIPADIPLTIVTAVECVGAKLEYNQCFLNRSYLQSIDDVNSKQFSFSELNGRFNTHRLTDILSPQLCDTTAGAYKELVKALQRLSYIPYSHIQDQHTIYLYHSTTDLIMPMEQSQTAEAILKDSCTAKVYHKYDDFGSHDAAILPFVRYVILRCIL